MTIIVSHSDTEEITALLYAYGDALKNCNVQDAISLYTADGVIMPPHFSASVGTKALQNSYDRIFSTSHLLVSFQIQEIVILSPEWAFARTTAKGTKTMLATQKSESAENQELFVVKKENGKWKIARYAFSSMKPLVQNGVESARSRL